MTADVRCARNAAAPSVVSRGARASGSIRADAAPGSFGVLILGWGVANQPAVRGTMVPTLGLTMLVSTGAGGR